MYVVYLLLPLPLLLAVASPQAATPGRAADLAEPVPLRADGKLIDHGAVWGHCGPTIADVDGDGLPDLVVGDFGGTFTVYRNIGTRNAPKYAAGKPLMAGGVEAKVPIY